MQYQGPHAQQVYNPRVYSRQNNGGGAHIGGSSSYNSSPFMMQSQNKETPKIRVVVRKRPLGSKEVKNGDIDVLEVKNDKSLVVKELK